MCQREVNELCVTASEELTFRPSLISRPTPLSFYAATPGRGRRDKLRHGAAIWEEIRKGDTRKPRRQLRNHGILHRVVTRTMPQERGSLHRVLGEKRPPPLRGDERN